MNLLTDRWISVLRRDGTVSCITPFELTDQIDSNAILKLNVSRPDFNGALSQFLIGLLQTALPNLTARQWREWYTHPPSTEKLKELFRPFESNFNLFSDGPCFMQDFDSLERKGAVNPTVNPIAAMLIEQPGEQTLKENKDHFIKRGRVMQLCPACTAAALFTLQINAPSGGQGHRTSMRGGGPLTTLVISENQKRQNLWNMLFLNILTQRDFENYTKLKITPIEESAVFPWMQPTITSENDRQVDTSHVHPLQMYWGMPRRIRLIKKDSLGASCDLCGAQNDVMVAEYITQNKGMKYSEHWKHALSPYRMNKDNQFFPMHPQPGGIGYQYWLSLTLENPASIVAANHQRLLIDEQESGEQTSNEIKIWAFGYDMDNMKARCWYEVYMPFYNVNEAQIKDLQSITKQFINATKQAEYYLTQALKSCDLSINAARKEIWQKTESRFYELLHSIINLLNNQKEEELNEIKENWLKTIQQQTRDIFEDLSDVQHAELRTMEKYVLAKERLLRCLYGKKMRGLLELSSEQEEEYD